MFDLTVNNHGYSTDGNKNRLYYSIVFHNKAYFCFVIKCPLNCLFSCLVGGKYKNTAKRTLDAKRQRQSETRNPEHLFAKCEYQTFDMAVGA